MINEKRLLDTFIGYAMIDSETKNEKAMGEKLVEDLKALGLEVKTDKAGEGFAGEPSAFFQPRRCQFLAQPF